MTGLTIKTCFKCGVEKPLSEFYRHQKMVDGHLNKCKDCTRRDVSVNYADKREAYAAYDKKRLQTAKRRQDIVTNTRRHRKQHPERYKARSAVNNAIRDGRLQKQPCVVCGTLDDLQAHHTDYSKPLDVVWYCGKHHRTKAHNLHA